MSEESSCLQKKCFSLVFGYSALTIITLYPRAFEGNPKDVMGSHGISWDPCVIPVGTHGISGDAAGSHE